MIDFDFFDNRELEELFVATPEEAAHAQRPYWNAPRCDCTHQQDNHFKWAGERRERHRRNSNPPKYDA
eukprot:3820344-Amphidinium_carterae.1